MRDDMLRKVNIPIDESSNNEANSELDSPPLLEEAINEVSNMVKANTQLSESKAPIRSYTLMSTKGIKIEINSDSESESDSEIEQTKLDSNYKNSPESDNEYSDIFNVSKEKKNLIEEIDNNNDNILTQNYSIIHKVDSENEKSKCKTDLVIEDIESSGSSDVEETKDKQQYNNTNSLFNKLSIINSTFIEEKIKEGNKPLIEEIHDEKEKENESEKENNKLLIEEIHDENEKENNKPLIEEIHDENENGNNKSLIEEIHNENEKENTKPLIEEIHDENEKENNKPLIEEIHDKNENENNKPLIEEIHDENEKENNKLLIEEIHNENENNKPLIEDIHDENENENNKQLLNETQIKYNNSIIQEIKNESSLDIELNKANIKDIEVLDLIEYDKGEDNKVQPESLADTLINRMSTGKTIFDILDSELESSFLKRSIDEKDTDSEDSEAELIINYESYETNNKKENKYEEKQIPISKISFKDTNNKTDKEFNTLFSKDNEIEREDSEAEIINEEN
ncbi:hypothetical protein BCR36DRAFT_372844 [Piromyces finnis]|uniref:Uncharacterized protein n=1 Tax=Piromyces finnis TaxID=1754191 RepID=A0A1Y1V1G0_9FUNG|nr:hypothetical protein BCR36DRAFT_372844 [Piromyces finnis]|eukprot:ORX45165.1 hypothetical protein BCR36DRAFT_372844 [Piromyces finnis]